MVSRQRSQEAQSIIETVRRWAEARADVRGVVVVGSWARGAARMDSDIDIVVINDGHRVVYDPDGALAALSARCR